MDDGKIISLYFERDERAIDETRAKYGAYCNAIAYNILSCTEDARNVKMIHTLPHGIRYRRTPRKFCECSSV